MKVVRLRISYLKYVLHVDILTLMTENLLEMACCGTALRYIYRNYCIPFRTLTNEKFVVVSYNSAVLVGPCHHGMALPQVADRGTVSDKEGSCE